MTEEEPPEGGLVDWAAWGPEPFERARERQRPILLSLSAPWCEACREMDRTTYADPRIAAHVDDGFVAVRADVDRHPRVRERYTMGGFPSTAFLTPDGRVITGMGDAGPETMRSALDAARRAWDARGAEAGRVPRALQDPEPPRGDVDARIEAHMVEQVAAAFDAEFGGWGTDAKFPLPRTVEFACKRDRDRATRTLAAIHTHLYDTYDGGFYRYAAARDWSRPHREKLLDENAALVGAFATGYLYTGTETYREAAAGTVDYLTTDLWIGSEDGESGAFAASQAGGDYFTMAPTEREAADSPRIDRTIYPGRNGLAADALLRLSAYTGDRAPRRYAERALDRVCDALVADDGTVRHAADPVAESGLLIDHARLLGGLTTAVGVTGADRYLSTARAVADEALDLRADDGAFLDGPAAGPGLLDRPLRPLGTNAECADALIDLAYLTGEARYREAAADALAAFAGAADRMGVEVAGYAAACARHHDDPLVIETPAAGSRLHRAAWRIADHEKVVVPGARESDAVVVRGGERRPPAGTPDELVERAAEVPYSGAGGG